MDIVIPETERQPRTSVVAIHFRAIGSSVGSSFFRLCNLRDLARERATTKTLLRHQGSLAAQLVINLDFFAPICDNMH